MITTRHMLDRGWWETNPIFGRHPTNARLAATSGAYFGAEVAGAYLLKRYGQHHKWARVFWIAEPTYQIQEHIRFAAKKESMPQNIQIGQR